MQKYFSFKTLQLGLSASILILGSVESAVAKPTYVIFDPAGSTGTYAFGLNNEDWVTGAYIGADGASHAFARHPDGTIESKDPAGSTATIAYNIDDQNNVAGSYTDSGGIQHGLVWHVNEGTIDTYDPKGSVGTYGTDIDKGETDGSYYDKHFFIHGFIRNGRGKITSFDPAGSINTYVWGISKGAATGYYNDGATDHCFIRSADGTITAPIDPPSSLDSQCWDINGKSVAGYYTGTDFKLHGFVRAPDGTISTVDVSGADDGTVANGINGKGSTIGNWHDSNNTAHGYVRRANGKIAKFDPQDSTNTYAWRINDTGSISGRYEDSSINHTPHGFLRMP